jgi:hypothetical protein
VDIFKWIPSLMEKNMIGTTTAIATVAISSTITTDEVHDKFCNLTVK